MWQAEYRLYIYPADIDKKISQKKLISALQKIEFIDELLIDKSNNNNDFRYKVGEEFLSLICFMGCSPNIEIEPQEDSPFCYVEIPSATKSMRFIAGDNVKKVNCPHCKKPQPDLVNKLLSCKVGALFSQHCTFCDKSIDPSMINWRRSAFIANSWVLLGNIYESEAIPDEKLLKVLEQASGCEWKYAYVRLKQKNMTKNIILSSTITCPNCKHEQEETMPTDACLWFYECVGCKTLLKPLKGDCCVFCSYATVPCPPIQEGDDSCCSS